MLSTYSLLRLLVITYGISFLNISSTARVTASFSPLTVGSHCYLLAMLTLTYMQRPDYAASTSSILSEVNSVEGVSAALVESDYPGQVIEITFKEKPINEAIFMLGTLVGTMEIEALVLKK